MPVTKSAIKKARQDQKRTARNKSFQKKLKSLIKKFLIDSNAQNFKLAQSAIDRAVKNKIYKKNRAIRLKSRLAKLLKVKVKKPATLKKTASQKTKPKTQKNK